MGGLFQGAAAPPPILPTPRPLRQGLLGFYFAVSIGNGTTTLPPLVRLLYFQGLELSGSSTSSRKKKTLTVPHFCSSQLTAEQRIVPQPGRLRSTFLNHLNAALENTSSELSTLWKHREAEQPRSSSGQVQGDVHATLATLKEMAPKEM